MAEEWDRFYRVFSPPGRMASATLFLHARSNPRGEARLVVVEGTGMGFEPIEGLHLDWAVFRPGTVFGEPRQSSSVVNQPFSAPDRFAIGGIRCYSGQPDPTDTSHFVMAYDIAQNHYVIEGWLRDDDTITFGVRPLK